MKSVKTVAFYLPQFYPTPENDEWWGKGYTEWRNVVNSKPLFKGHYQPRIPSELGFYDLRVPEVREQQVELAKLAGIDGFCYWHYWFAGRRLLDQAFTEVVEAKKPDFPFCLCWANHSWEKKNFADPTKNIMLLEQTYPGDDDIVNHFNALLPAFQDNRYIRVDGRLLFGIFAPNSFPIARRFFEIWNSLAEKNGLGGFFFFGLYQGLPGAKSAATYEGYDAIVCDTLHEVFEHPEEPLAKTLCKRFRRKFLGYPYTVDYDNYVRRSKEFFETHPEVIPCIEPDFDHSPRSGVKWIIIEGSTPKKWGCFFKETKKIIERNSQREGILFIKSWNEWGEGNYLEPDMKYGRQYIEEMAE